MNRSAWHLRANAPMVVWLVALLVVSLVHPVVPESRWLLIHLLLLGAVTNAIFVWSAHFAEALLRSPGNSGAKRALALRLGLLNVAVVLVVAGVVAGQWLVTLAGAAGVAGAVIWHGVSLVRAARKALPSRFGSTVRYYTSATAMLPIGVTFGVLLARGVDEPWTDRLALAHAAVNILGWVGLTVAGTLVTLWPTMLRTRIVDGAERAARQGLLILLGSLAVIVVSATLGWQYAAAIGVIGYLSGLGVLARPLVATARQKPPSSYSTWSVAAGCVWLVGSLVGLVVVLVASPDWRAVSDWVDQLVGPLAAGFAAQVLFGALSYLIPMALGGGPAVGRQTTAILTKGAGWRLTLINGGILIWLLPTPSLVRVISSSLALVGFASFLPLVVWAVRRSRQKRPVPPAESNGPGETREAKAASQPAQMGAVAAALAVLVLGVAAGVTLDPSVVKPATVGSVANGVTPTGHTTQIDVVAKDMAFTPSSVKVPAGDRLVIRVTNTDNMVHDLVLAKGQTSGRLSPDDSAQMNVGVVGENIDGWCSIVGHRQLGMVFAVEVTGVSAASQASHSGSATTGEQDKSAASTINLSSQPGKDFVAHDAALDPAPPGTVHKLTFTVQDIQREVAPGVKQTLWTYNGTAPGPTLRGRVGDTFEITVVNNGDIGHSIDFHAGQVSPDESMRPIAPGQSLVYTFIAQHSGIWLYHCSTMPMSSHVANGMYGAVIIDPPGLAPVDKEYLLVQSEYYLGPQGGVVDPDKVATERPDLVIFNGYANQYKYRPIAAKPGERVRIWVLDAGPNLPSAFHVVGTQFDTVYSEGAYRLTPNNPLAGGSQVLSLSAAQGGFVELTFPAPGHYSFVTHVMSDAEKGASGVFDVQP